MTSPLALDKVRGDLIYYAVRSTKLAATVVPDAKLRKLIKNMIMWGRGATAGRSYYAEVGRKRSASSFRRKVKAANLNLAAARAVTTSLRSYQARSVVYIARMDKTAGKIIVDGKFCGGQDACSPVARW